MHGAVKLLTTVCDTRVLVCHRTEAVGNAQNPQESQSWSWSRQSESQGHGWNRSWHRQINRCDFVSRSHVPSLLVPPTIVLQLYEPSAQTTKGNVFMPHVLELTNSTCEGSHGTESTGFCVSSLCEAGNHRIRGVGLRTFGNHCGLWSLSLLITHACFLSLMQRGAARSAYLTT
jgi:hypothetical protein